MKTLAPDPYLRCPFSGHAMTRWTPCLFVFLYLSYDYKHSPSGNYKLWESSYQLNILKILKRKLLQWMDNPKWVIIMIIENLIPKLDFKVLLVYSHWFKFNIKQF